MLQVPDVEKLLDATSVTLCGVHVTTRTADDHIYCEEHRAEGLELLTRLSYHG